MTPEIQLIEQNQEIITTTKIEPKYKTCRDCKKQDLIETFPKTKNRGKYVPMSRCSLCLAEFRKSYRVKAEKKEITHLKTCRVCGKQDLIENFPQKVDAFGEFKPLPNCQECHKKVRENYRLEHKDEIANYNKQWWTLHPDYKKERRKNNPETRRTESFYKNAASRGLPVELTSEKISELLHQACHYCGHFSDQLNGIDRLNPLFGYLNNNVVSCCTKCNFGKQTLDEPEFWNWINKIVNYQIQIKSEKIIIKKEQE